MSLLKSTNQPMQGMEFNLFKWIHREYVLEENLSNSDYVGCHNFPKNIHFNYSIEDAKQYLSMDYPEIDSVG